MKRRFFLIFIVLIIGSCFAQEKIEWKDLVPFSKLEVNDWKNIQDFYGKKLHGIAADCGYKKMIVWYLNEQIDYTVPLVAVAKKRVVIVIQSGNEILEAFCFDVLKDDIKSIVFSSPYSFGLQCCNKEGEKFFICGARNVDGILLNPLEDNTITDGAFEWSGNAIVSGGPFYFWDESQEKLFCLDVENGKIKDLKSKIKSPVFTYGKFQLMGLERELFVETESGTIYSLKDCRIKKSAGK